MLKIPSNDMMMMEVTTITKILTITFTKKKPVCFCVWIHLDVPVRIRYVSVDCWLQKLSSFANFTTCTYTHIHGILWEVTSIFYNFSYLGSSSSSFIHLQNTKLTNTNSFRFPVHQCDLSFIFVLFQSSKVVTTKCQVRTPQYKTSLKIRTKMC